MSTTVLVVRMTIYTVFFLSVMLIGIPAGLHYSVDWLLRQFASESSNLSRFASILPGQQAIGMAIFAGGLLGYLFCSIWLAAVGQGPFVEFDPPRHFVATGPYRWCRNPVAALLIVTVFGEAVYFGSAGILLFVLVGLPIAHRQVTKLEEPLLRKRFGAPYEQYCREVPRWWPRLTPYSSGTAETN